jgi:hypothetical protein
LTALEDGNNYNNKYLDITLAVFLFTAAGYLGTNVFVYPIVILYILIKIVRVKFSYFSLIISLIIIYYASVKLASHDVAASILTIKYFFGFFLFYFLFDLKSNLVINFVKLALLISIITIAEALLVNTIIPREMWLHYPVDEFGDIGHAGLFWGVYQRPYGIGTSATVTSALIVVLISLGDSQKLRKKKNIYEFWLPILAVFLSLSGTGILLLAAYYLIKHFKISLVLFIAFLPFILIVFSNLSLQINLFEKIAPKYILYLLEYKKIQILEEFNIASLNEIIFGINWSIDSPMPLGGDLGFLNAYNYGGFFVIIFYLVLCTFIYWRGKFTFALNLLLLSGLHYFALFTLLGQIIFGYLLFHSIKKRNVNVYS